MLVCKICYFDINFFFLLLYFDFFLKLEFLCQKTLLIKIAKIMIDCKQVKLN